MTTWSRATLDLINRFSQTNLWPLLEILILLPEELESRSVRLGENRRQELKEDFKSCASTVNEFLKHCCGTYGMNLHEHVNINVKIVRCFTSWISIGAISLPEIKDNVVITKAFSILAYRCDSGDSKQISGALHDAATECICTLLQCLEDNNNQQATESYLENNNNQQALESYLFHGVLSLEVPYHMSVANEDQEKSINYCRIFTELAESFLEKMIQQHLDNNTQHYSIKILDLVLLCVGHHDYEVAEITFNFWYLLSEELYHKNSKSVTESFRPYVERLVFALCRHCQMEPDHEGLLEEGEDFKEFRLKVSDLIKDVVFIVGSSSCFRQMFINLQTPGVTWESSEAALYIMQAVAKNVLP